MLWMMISALTAHAEGFVGVSWRGYAMAEHLSHGPAFTAGASLLDERLRLGVAATTRPGALNPATFALDVSGEPYNGQDTLQLRSDGGTLGLMVAPGAAVLGGRAHLSAPLMIGYGGYGFFLVGDDRQTPDGRKPSAWEDALLDGQDSAFGVVVDGGVQLALGAGPVRPTASLHYHAVLGYDATYTGRYAGPAVALGVEVVPGLSAR